jgi:EH_Signature domain
VPIDLQRMLSWTNARAFEGLIFDRTPITKEIATLEKSIGSGAIQRPARNLVFEALKHFYQSLTVSTLREAQLVCYGCVEPFGDGTARLIEDERRFPKLLDCVEQYRPSPRALRRCYRGLLSGYFRYDPDGPTSSAVGKNNWSRLRNYLHERVEETSCSEIEPDWVGAIVRHKNLLTHDPCARYALSLLSGDAREFEEAKRGLDIPDASWLVIRLIFAQVDAAVSGNDSVFLGYLSRLLALLEEHRLVLDSELAKVLERYRKCEGSPSSTLLREFAVANWGIPWLSSNNAKWGRVSEGVQRMVADWLKLELLQQFFGLLAEDGANDKRRLRFWERYIGSIDDIYFALGSHASGNRSRDFVELRKKMRGRVLDLRAGGVPRNNAFIMRMGDHVAVEFGVRGNACFIFEHRHLPFDLNRSAVAGDRTELKHDRHVDRLLHIDGNAGRWEQQFEGKLRKLMRVQPIPKGSRVASRGAPTKETAASSTHTGKTSYSRSDLDRFAASRGLRLRDLTAHRGNLWVVTGQSDQTVNRQLSEWGFRYKPNKGWWREK